MKEIVKHPTRPDNIDDLLCPIRYTLEIVGGKWKLPIICTLAVNGPQRYSEIQRKLGDITNMMLSQSLKELAAEGMVHRKQYNEVPPRVVYSLTAKGDSMLPALKNLAGWGAQQIGEHDCVYCDECSKAG